MSGDDERRAGRRRSSRPASRRCSTPTSTVCWMRRRSRRRSPPATAWSGRSWRSWSSGAATAGSRTRQTREIAERKLGARLDGILASEEKIAALKHARRVRPAGGARGPGVDRRPARRATTSTCSGTSRGCWTSPTCRSAARSTTTAMLHDGRRLEDFEQFEPLFKQKHAELREGTSKLLPYPGMAHIVAGRVLRPQRRHAVHRRGRRDRVQEDDGAGEQARTAPRASSRTAPSRRCTASRLAIRLSDEDGQIVVQTEMPEILTDDEVSGYIYVLRSLSEDPQIAGIKDLHKIGFSRDAVEKRIKNAEKSPTYLMAPVEVVATYRTYNLQSVGAGEPAAPSLRRGPARPHPDRPQGSRLRPVRVVRRPAERDRPGDRPDHLRRHRRLRLRRQGAEAC